MEHHKSLYRPAGVKIHYRVSVPDQGDIESLPTLVLIHGVASNLTRWTEFLLNTTLRPHCRIVRLDLRGHSRSQTDIDVGMNSWCDDLLALLEQERATGTCIVGHSLGAQVAINFAHRFPGSVQNLVLVDPVVPHALKGRYALGRYLRHFFSVLASSVAWLRRRGFGRRDFVIRDLYELDQATRKHMTNNPNADLARLYHSPTADMHFIPISNYVRDMCEVLRPLPPLQEINTPSLALLARDPSISDADKNMRELEQLPSVDIETIDADHWPLTEKPVETREAIERWCLRHWGIEPA